MNRHKTIAVIGATGKQGGAVIDALLSAPNGSEITIFALTRNINSASAKRLAEKSLQQIRLVQGDLDDCPGIFRAIATPVDGLFCVTLPALGPWARSDAEETQGKALVDAALEHGVGHFVLTSVDRHGADSDTKDTDVPHFISKAKIERHLREKCAGTQMTWTMLRPTAFMDNLQPGFAGKIFPTAWKVGLLPTTKLQLISSVDIGYFGAQALLRPMEFKGREISLAGDELTFVEANAVFKEKFGYDIPTTFGFVGTALLWAVADLRLMFKFFNEVGYGSDIQQLRKEHPSLLSLRDWLDSSAFAVNPK